MNLELMRQIDEQFLETPFFGVRQMTWHLKQRWAHPVNREAYSAADATDGADADLPEAQHQQGRQRGTRFIPICSERACAWIGPTRSGAADITYLPMQPRVPVSGGNHGLVHTRKVLAWRISNTLEADFCVEALNEAIHKFGPAGDNELRIKAAQFTSFVVDGSVCDRSGVRISMDGKGRFLDNIFIERLWRTLKYECVYLHAWETGSEAKHWHSELDGPSTITNAHIRPLAAGHQP
jgi:putative transposase